MLLVSLTALSLLSSACSEGQAASHVFQRKSYVFPFPFEQPNRNDRAEQCWVRIEDLELIETLTVYCHLAHEFLRGYLREYNSRKMLEDDVDVGLWSEDPKPMEEELPKPVETDENGKKIKDWRVTTVLDPTTHNRIYVTQKADCSLVIYSREGMSNYRVDCARLLYFVNHHMNGSVVLKSVKSLIAMCVLILFLNKLM